ncbi:primosomal protein N' family DNA-binding protein [Parafrigoribacterium humi]|jgi:primosomal protein N' (replication factor Y)|uniref:primosomal protein N' family DNA-binding protein n=1 Tax=Parafrigoribacterium humi TaxID=3144664 RepID=UPI0032EFF3B2
MAASIARVLLDSSLPQLDRLFDYRVPEQYAQEAGPGVRVRVPLRSAGRIADGFIVELTDSVDYPGTLSELESVVSTVPILTPEVWALARRLADRAAGNASDILRLAIPKRQVRVEKAWLAAPEPRVSGVKTAPASGESEYAPSAFDDAIAHARRASVEVTPLVSNLPNGRWVGRWAVAMANAAARCLAAGKTAILCVPDYRDQEQLSAALEAVLPPEQIVRLDARQSNPDRYRSLLACLDDSPLVVVGNRSVIYAPAANLGLIALWDDGDPLHSEPLSPYVHSRDAALVRQELQGCSLLFYSHARSAEVQRLVELGWLGSIAPVRRYLPKVIPTQSQSSDDRLAAQARIPSTAWKQARSALEHGPVLVQVARPGYLPRLSCASCHRLARCKRCSGPLGLASARSTPACLWCGALAAEWACQNCEGTRLRAVGQGATRTAEELGRAFPGVRVIVADGERPILTVGAEPSLVIATRGAEPIASGGYRAVLLLDGDRMLARESLRVAEDCLRWWANATALAARGAATMLVGVGGALASALATWRLDDYLHSELEDRRTLRFPPAVRVASVSGSTDAVDAAIAAVSALETESASLDVLGPVDVADVGVRAIVRFDYAAGARVAAVLKAEIVRNATTRRRRAAGSDRSQPLPTLKVRFDDTEPFAQ